MERSEIARQVILSLLLAVSLAGCDNPFAPTLRGAAGSPFTDASTVGGLLQNFVTAYELRDSLRYAELLDADFQFQYYDPTLQRTDGWFRETDLRATARVFRSFQNITLIWGGLSADEEAISTPDVLVEVRVQYQLVLDELSPVIGFARFTLFKPAGDRFRIVLWQDDF
jgi:hypothetical protein